MKKTSFLFLLCSLSAWAMDSEKNDLSVVTKAAYFIYEGNEHDILTSGIPGNANYATFYTATGDKIEKVTKTQCDFFELKR